MAVALQVFVVSGLYRSILRYASLTVSIAVIKSLLICGVFYVAVLVALGLLGVPRTLGMLQPHLLLLALPGSSWPGSWAMTRSCAQ